MTPCTSASSATRHEPYMRSLSDVRSTNTDFPRSSNAANKPRSKPELTKCSGGVDRTRYREPLSIAGSTCRASAPTWVDVESSGGFAGTATIVHAATATVTTTVTRTTTLRTRRSSNVIPHHEKVSHVIAPIAHHQRST